MAPTYNRYRTPYNSRPSRWRARLLYLLAGIGLLALTGITFIIYEALQVPEANLETAIPFPQLTSPEDKVEAIPNISPTPAGKAAAATREPAYAYFYTSQPNDTDEVKAGKLRTRPKPVKRTKAAAKAKKAL